jgi:Flp pilus assembly protein TadG
MVKFVLVLPILLLLVIGAPDFRRAFHIKVRLENAAREGAYYMVCHST